MAIRDLRGLMRDLLERIHFSRLKHENTGLESVSNIQVEQRRLPAYLKAKTEGRWPCASRKCSNVAGSTSGMIVIWQGKPSRNKAGAYMKTSTNKDHRT